jgi:hypothetical protein
MQFASHVHRDYLEVTVGGEFDLVAGKAGADELFRLCTQHALSRVLVDATNLSDQVSVGSRFTLGEYLAAHGTQPIRIAIVTSSKLVTDSKALENTANNRGAQVITTDSMQGALEFLGIAGDT